MDGWWVSWESVAMKASGVARVGYDREAAQFIYNAVARAVEEDRRAVVMLGLDESGNVNLKAIEKGGGHA